MVTTRRNRRVPTLGRQLGHQAYRAWIAAKETLRLPTQNDQFFYIDRLTHLLNSGTLKACKITATGRNDGAGSQAEARMSAICFAHTLNLEYIHTPFTSIEHAETEMDDWVKQWEGYFNLGHGAQCADGLSIVPLKSIFRTPRRLPPDTVCSTHHYLHWCRQNPEAWERARPRLRHAYWANKTEKAQPFTVAVHVRRGDRHTATSVFVPSLQFLTAYLSKQVDDLRICVHSQGDASSFANFGQFDCTLCLNEPAITTHRQLVSADILLISAGAFSYTAGVLNAGLVLSGPQKYGALPSWSTRQSDGQFDMPQLRHSVERLLQRRAARV